MRAIAIWFVLRLTTAAECGPNSVKWLSAQEKFCFDSKWAVFTDPDGVHHWHLFGSLGTIVSAHANGTRWAVKANEHYGIWGCGVRKDPLTLHIWNKYFRVAQNAVTGMDAKCGIKTYGDVLTVDDLNHVHSPGAFREARLEQYWALLAGMVKAVILCSSGSLDISDAV